MKDQKNKDALLDAFGRLPDSVLEEANHYSKTTVRKSRYFRRTAVTLLAAVLCLVLVTVTVMAAVPALRRYLNLDFVSESNRQESVPEGWVGIYTAEDLDNIRNGLDGKYILMNDLTFPEDAEAFTPIGTKDAPFTGQFDGNGYVIRGITIDMTATAPTHVITSDDLCYYYDLTGRLISVEKINKRLPADNCYYLNSSLSTYAGIFGYCDEVRPEDEITADGDTVCYTGHLMEVMDTAYGGLIKNLGVENATLRVTDALRVNAGIIAGRATYVTACYTQNCTIEIVGFASEKNPSVPVLDGQIMVGGLVGSCLLMDSCYAAHNSLSISRLSAWPAVDPENDVIMSFVGNLSGHAYTAVTSYVSDCTLTTSDDCGGKLQSGDLCGHISVVPHLMTSEQYQYLTNRLLEMYDGNRDDFYYKQFCSYFVCKQLSDYTGNHYYYNPTFFIGEFDHTSPVYVFDLTATFREELMRERTILQAMTAEEAFHLYTAGNIKVGMLACFVLEDEADYNAEDFAEFDFDTIWQMKDGRPALRIFG